MLSVNLIERHFAANRLDQLLDARSQTEPGTGAGGSAGG